VGDDIELCIEFDRAAARKRTFTPIGPTHLRRLNGALTNW
jgi:hypothetical protein